MKEDKERGSGLLVLIPITLGIIAGLFALSKSPNMVFVMLALGLAVVIVIFVYLSKEDDDL